MQIYWKSNPTKFNSDVILNKGTLGLFEKRHPNKKNKNNNKMSSDVGSAPDAEIK